MTIVIENPEVEAQLDQLARQSGRSPGEVVAALLSAFATTQDDAWWESLTPTEQERHLQHLDRSFAAAAAGMVSDGPQAVARIRQRNRPAHES